MVHKPTAAATAKSLQSCPTLCHPIDGSPPGSSVHGIFQARVLEWGAIAFSTSLNETICLCCAVLCWVTQSCPTLCNPMNCSPSGSSRQEYWSGLPCPSPGDLPNPGTEPRSPALQADSLPAQLPGKPDYMPKTVYST